MKHFLRDLFANGALYARHFANSGWQPSGVFCAKSCWSKCAQCPRDAARMHHSQMQVFCCCEGGTVSWCRLFLLCRKERIGWWCVFIYRLILSLSYGYMNSSGRRTQFKDFGTQYQGFTTRRRHVAIAAILKKYKSYWNRKRVLYSTTISHVLSKCKRVRSNIPATYRPLY